MRKATTNQPLTSSTSNRCVGQIGGGSALCLVFDGHGRDNGRIVTHLLDAGLVAGPIFEQVSGSILMSGTLNPPGMFADLLGISQKREGN